MKEKLLAALLKHHPALKPKTARKYVDKYTQAVIPELARQMAGMSSEDFSTGEIDFPINQVTKACGAAKAFGPHETIMGVMQMHGDTSLIIKLYEGNSITHRVSRVCLNQNYKKDIMQELKSIYVEQEPSRVAALTAKANKIVRIDAASLDSYIKQTQIDLSRKNDAAYEEKLIRNLQVAKQLKSLVKWDDAGAFVEEYWEQIDSGRMHGHGLSLQRILKEVRHAALGRCYRYDFKAASYALMTAYALSIDPTLKVAAINDYVRHRSAIRKRIAKAIGVSEDRIKTVFTAIGFGAQLKDNPYNSIRGLLGQDAYHRLLSNLEFSLIKQQLDAVSATIAAELGAGDFEMAGLLCTALDPHTGHKRTKNQRLAWVYQRFETMAMELFRDMVPSECQQLLVVHDCVYLDRPIPARHLADIKVALSAMFPMLNVEGEWVTPIHTADFIRPSVLQAREEDAAHRARIAVEEQRAMFYKSPRLATPPAAPPVFQTVH
ncbi:hypothetical protein [Hydrogenophaga defluvii]|uniref:Telomere resolvase n=1 Tax=Hydrogenophaga defluvii TaxID=249410 RepID=A0ABW2SE55_9BURK